MHQLFLNDPLLSIKALTYTRDDPSEEWFVGQPNWAVRIDPAEEVANSSIGSTRPMPLQAMVVGELTYNLEG